MVGVAVDGAGNVYVAGWVSDNAFRITPAGTITEIIDASGDGAGNTLDGALSVAVDGAGRLYVTGEHSDNVLQITPFPILCGVAMSQEAYTVGDTLEMTTLSFANLFASPVTVRLRVQLLFGTLFTVDLIDLGADGTFRLPAGAKIRCMAG